MEPQDMRCSKEAQKMARMEMTYWKRYISLENVFASELAFSLIYDNIKADKQALALATMGLARLPEVMFLVQVDDYVSKYSDIEVTHEFYTKASVRICLQKALDRSDYVGFAANLVGMDTLVCFLCLPKDHEETALDEFAGYLRELVERETKVAVTICISEICRKLSDYPVAYTKARDLLFDSFYLGKNAAVVSSRDSDQAENSGYLSQVMDFYPNICVALSNGDPTRFEQILQDVCQRLREQRVHQERSCRL